MLRGTIEAVLCQERRLAPDNARSGSIAVSELTIERATPNRERLLDHRHAPLLEGVLAYHRQESVPFATPGHTLGVGAHAELRATFGEQALRSDIPLGGGVGDTHFGGETLRVAEALAADAWGADRSYFLLNGSSAGNHAFLLVITASRDIFPESHKLPFIRPERAMENSHEHR